MFSTQFPPKIFSDTRHPKKNISRILGRRYGFRKHRSTGDLLAYDIHMWNRAIKSHGESRVVALDISKALDSVAQATAIPGDCASAAPSGKLFAANPTVDFQGMTPTTTFNVNSRMAEVKFQQRDIKKILQNLNTNKASGPGQIPAIVLKRCAVELTPILCKFFRISYEQGVFSSSWKIGCVQPIPKKGKKTDPTNYRPVALLSIMSKVMEAVINTQLLKYLDNNNILHDRQYGFRKHRSTGDLLAYVTHMWNRAIENHGASRVVAVDISKAFDRVWHEGPLAKLAAYGLPPGLRQWLNSFLNDRCLFVAVEGCSSAVFPINAGVPQGSVFSPTLFLLYINERLQIICNTAYSFAGDSTLVSCMESGKPLPSQKIARLRPHHASQISADIKKIGIVNKVLFNRQKTQKITLSWKFHVGLSTDVQWSVTIDNTASQRLGVSFHCRKLYTPEQFLLNRTSLEYCSHVSGCAPKYSLKLLDSIQKRAGRCLNLHSLEHQRKVAGLSLLCRFYRGRCSSELSQIITPKAVLTRNTREAWGVNPYEVEVSTPQASLLQHSFFSRTSMLRNEPPERKLLAANSTVDFQGDTATTILNVKKILQNANMDNASGANQIPAIVLKRCGAELTPILWKLFTISYLRHLAVVFNSWLIQEQLIPAWFVDGRTVLHENLVYAYT
nr:unnamed protein product [Callosobruchus analis]